MWRLFIVKHPSLNGLVGREVWAFFLTAQVVSSSRQHHRANLRHVPHRLQIVDIGRTSNLSFNVLKILRLPSLEGGHRAARKSWLEKANRWPLFRGSGSIIPAGNQSNPSFPFHSSELWLNFERVLRYEVARDNEASACSTPQLQSPNRTRLQIGLQRGSWWTSVLRW